MTSDEGLDAAVEEIMRDPEYAQRVYEDPEHALRQYDLRPGEWRLVHWFLQQDVKDSLGEAKPGGSSIDFSAIRYQFLGRLPSFRGDVIAGPSDPTIV